MFLVGAVGGRDEEHEVRGAVLGAEVHGWGEASHGERGLGDRRRAAVRDGDAARDAGGRLLLPCQRVCIETVHFGGPALRGNLLREVADHLGTCGPEVDVQSHELRSDDFGHQILSCEVGPATDPVARASITGIVISRCVTTTADGVVWSSDGTVEPGRPAAADP